MIHELTDIFEMLEKRYPDFINNSLDHYAMRDLKRHYLPCNTHNLIMKETMGDLRLKNNQTQEEHVITFDGKINFLPVRSTTNPEVTEHLAFSIGASNKATCIRVNEKGLFVEDYDLRDIIKVAYYDSEALQYIISLHQGIDCQYHKVLELILDDFKGEIDQITQDEITHMYGLKPDLVFKTDLKSRSIDIYDRHCLADSAIFGGYSYYSDFIAFMQNQDLYQKRDYPYRFKK